jgi:hypothetical protein
MGRFASSAYQVVESNENLKVEIVARKKAEALIATNLRDMTLINELSNHLIREGSDFNRNLNAVVETAIAIAGADKGKFTTARYDYGSPYVSRSTRIRRPILELFRVGT